MHNVSSVAIVYILSLNKASFPSQLLPLGAYKTDMIGLLSRFHCHLARIINLVVNYKDFFVVVANVTLALRVVEETLFAEDLKGFVIG